MKQSLLTIPETGFDSDDFAMTIMLNRLETGEDVDNEEFSVFVRKCQDLIRNLNNLLKRIG